MFLSLNPPGKWKPYIPQLEYHVSCYTPSSDGVTPLCFIELSVDIMKSLEPYLAYEVGPTHTPFLNNLSHLYPIFEDRTGSGPIADPLPCLAVSKKLHLFNE